MIPEDPNDRSYIANAREICESCPVQRACLEYTLTFPPSNAHGVWAGKTPRQLVDMAKSMGITEFKPTAVKLWNSYHK